ncbi:MAG: signal peptide peptidase SppA [Candidatus Melainabacteria bacterium]|nr:signal peptide peptidase SppA [Candidatus Melainabacteria bacterium]
MTTSTASHLGQDPASSQPASPALKPKNIGLWVGVGALGVLLAGFLLVALMMTVLSPAKLPYDRLMQVTLSGVISGQPDQGSGLFSSESTALRTRKALDDLLEDDTVKGVLLVIDSPGGTVGMSQELFESVRRLRKKKPVVVSIADVAASGGYYTACAADKIYANPGSITGSIGVIISTLNFHQLMEQKLGVKGVTIKSGRFKDLLSPYRAPQADELAMIQQLVMDSYDQFIGVVVENRTRFLQSDEERKQREASLRAIADGRVLIGSQALKVGLVDAIGDRFEAEKALEQMAKERFSLPSERKLSLEEYRKSSLGFVDMLLGQSPATFFAKSGTGLESLVPFSARHLNQPLWLLE